MTDQPDPALLQTLLQESSQLHRHLCPRQVLGVRIGLYGLNLMAIAGDGENGRFHNRRKNLITFVETDGCGADGIAVATDCWVGRRTLRLFDYGKVAATLVDRKTEQAIRIWASPAARQLAQHYAPDAPTPWHAYLHAYQVMPDTLLLRSRPVTLAQPLAVLISRPNRRVECAVCGEEIINEREVMIDGRFLCHPCAGNSYCR